MSTPLEREVRVMLCRKLRVLLLKEEEMLQKKKTADSTVCTIVTEIKIHFITGTTQIGCCGQVPKQVPQAYFQPIKGNLGNDRNNLRFRRKPCSMKGRLFLSLRKFLIE